jgi:hypothetical protein
MGTVQGIPFLQPLDVNGAAMGTPVRATSEAASHVNGAIGVALRGDDAVVVWAENLGGVYLHAGRVNLSTRTVARRVALTRALEPASEPGIALDGPSGFAVAFRAPTMMGGSVAIMRLDASLRPRDLSRVGAAGTGDVVRIASQSGNTFLVGWSDESATHTTAQVQVMRCP